jgi:hypothetical protein
MKHARKDYDRIQDPAGLIGEDEPVFLLRAKDELAPAAIRYWATKLLLAGGDPATLKIALDQARRMELWSVAHESKLPDVPFNTCGNCGRSFQEGEELRLHNAEPCEW